MAAPTDRTRFHGEARRDRYDVIVVGSGIGGLTTAAMLADAGRSVLVVERHDRLGGYAHAFRRGAYLFDSSVHMVGGCANGGLVGQLLETLGIADRCQFTPLDPCYRAVFPGLDLAVPTGVDAFIDAHEAAFPGRAHGLRALMGHCRDIRRELRAAAELPSHLEALGTPARFPTLTRYRRATLAQLMAQHEVDPQLQAVFASLWPFLGLPPSQVSFVYWATMLLSYIEDGAYYCRGTFQRFANVLGDAIKERGGELLLRSVVRRIRLDNGRVTGIVLENGQHIDAPVVVSNADARQTAEELVGAAALPTRYMRTVRRLVPSVSAFVVYAATDLDLAALGIGHESFVYSEWNHETTQRRIGAEHPTWLTITAPTISDPSLAPTGEHLLILTTLVPNSATQPWERDKAREVHAMLTVAEREIPDLRNHIRFAEGATPRTMERYTRNTAGAIYGWALSPQQVGPARPSQRTPLDGLYLAGHWTRPGGGVYGVVASGVDAARAIIGHASEIDRWKTLTA